MARNQAHNSFKMSRRRNKNNNALLFISAIMISTLRSVVASTAARSVAGEFYMKYMSFRQVNQNDAISLVSFAIHHTINHKPNISHNIHRNNHSNQTTHNRHNLPQPKIHGIRRPRQNRHRGRSNRRRIIRPLIEPKTPLQSHHIHKHW